MTDEFRTKLIAAGMEFDTAIDRFLNNEDMLDKFLKKFLEDPSYASLISAVEAGDCKAAFAASHTLKGVAGNFSFEELRRSSSEACECFRAENFEAGAAIIPEVKEAYEKIVIVLKEEYSE